MLNSLFSAWQKPDSAQSEYGGGSDYQRSGPIPDRRSGHYRATSWSSKTRPGIVDNRSPFVVNGGYFTGAAPNKAYSTAGSFRQRHDDSEDFELQRYRSSPQVTVQEKLILSLFQHQQRSSRRKTIREKYSSRAATEVDFHDIKERNEDQAFIKAIPPINPPQSPRQQYYPPQQHAYRTPPPPPPQQRKHVYAQSEYGERGAGGIYDGAQLRRLAKQAAPEEEYGGLNDWGLPIAPQYDDYDEEDENEQINSDFSDDEDSEIAKSVTYQQLVDKYTKSSHKGSISNRIQADSIVQSGSLSLFAKTTAKTQTQTASLQTQVQQKVIVKVKAADRFVLLTYVLFIVCPIARQKSSALLAILAIHPAYYTVLVQKMLVLAYLLSKTERVIKISTVTTSKTAAAAAAGSPVSSASTLVDKQKRRAADSKTRIVASQSVRHSAARASSLRNSYSHKEQFSSWGF